MKKLNLSIAIFAASILFTCCNKLDIKPESDLPDDMYWNSEADLITACNRLYETLQANWLDSRGDDNVNQTANLTSNGAWTIPNTSDEWNFRYRDIRTANNILEKGGKAKATDIVKNRYFAEARFFRAYSYFLLVQKYGDVPLILHTLDKDAPELLMGRNPRAEVMKAIYEDLDYAAAWLPDRATLSATQWGRVMKSTAWGLKARIGLYEGTRLKFRSEAGWEAHLQTAISSANQVTAQGHSLYPTYDSLFVHFGEGQANKEAIFIKPFGVSATNVILGHNYSRDMENGRNAITRNLIHQYLYSDGLPAFNTDNTPVATPSPLFVSETNEPSYNTIFENRDPRLTYTIYKNGETSYKGTALVANVNLGSRSGYYTKKGWNKEDWQVNNSGTTDRILMRYAEILLILAEAKFELNGSISDADLNLTVNALRTRAKFAPKLSNAFVTANNLSMREEIRRERTVELALEGFRYDDLIRWKTAETVLPQELLGSKFVATEWQLSGPGTIKLNSNNMVVAEPADTRRFQANRDYLYPVPVNEITTSGNAVTQNPNWK